MAVKALVYVSLTRELRDTAAGTRLQQRARDVLALFAESDIRVLVDGQLVVSDLDPVDIADANGTTAIVFSRNSRTVGGQALEPAALIERLRQHGHLAFDDVAAPFAGCFQLDSHAPFLMATDRC